ncbi:uncharacterized protein LOC119552521 [Drosophila subpulchrella]|uniref:uncharacterized protein LOC119552521 n=1 Tax=Drosophila subpulchrella TaxID=1486046 RepID=UPI0018A1890A|nr:uncharacterized protein LOC119552521 [Drosophila subpulchrella]
MTAAYRQRKYSARHREHTRNGFLAHLNLNLNSALVVAAFMLDVGHQNNNKAAGGNNDVLMLGALCSDVWAPQHANVVTSSAERPPLCAQPPPKSPTIHPPFLFYFAVVSPQLLPSILIFSESFQLPAPRIPYVLYSFACRAAHAIPGSQPN